MTAATSPDVDAYFAELAHPLRGVAEALRELLLSAHPDVVESIKWKAPNYAVAGADDFATLNLRRPTAVQLVLHTGAKVKPEHPELVVDAPAKLLKWPGRNRATASFASLAEFEDARGALEDIVRSWAAQVQA
ncbi:DUF1801 domain-containing protein [Pseudoclavibacter sp. AY1F1]|uniref:DUF1801 domain-containing protein n=1 Tax=Pseudoclavibacter sp. AY1F1 TaxID=2080583 RepID=UPI000CE8C15F|nr:DUF1801 domain-containing protein [Pseudoclavibacter sp. AY1F1]PPF44493.1 DUF1801 domain-containing protein [Pseudoclavibacter sp. AY1F1]